MHRNNKGGRFSKSKLCFCCAFVVLLDRGGVELLSSASLSKSEEATESFQGGGGQENGGDRWEKNRSGQPGLVVRDPALIAGG